MIYTMKPTKTKNIRIWLNEFPKMQPEISSVCHHTVKVTNRVMVDDQFLAFEFGETFKHSSNYALLGARFQNNDTDDLSISIQLSLKNGPIYQNAINSIGGTIHVGIIEEYKTGITKAIDRFAKQNALPTGSLDFCVGAHGDIGSSEYVFFLVTDILLKILVMNPLGYLNESMEGFVRETLVDFYKPAK